MRVTQDRTSSSPATTSSQGSPVRFTPTSTTPSRAGLALGAALRSGAIAETVDTYITMKGDSYTSIVIRDSRQQTGFGKIVLDYTKLLLDSP